VVDEGKETRNADSIVESKVIYYLEQCGLGVLFFLPLSSINMLSHQQNIINNTPSIPERINF